MRKNTSRRWKALLLSLLLCTLAVFNSYSVFAAEEEDAMPFAPTGTQSAERNTSNETDPEKSEYEEEAEESDDESIAPTDETQMPVDETQMPVDETNAPVDETQVTADETGTSEAETEALVEETESIELLAEPFELPATVSTIDNAAHGISMNLFDYDTSDTWANNPQNRNYIGINSLSALSFFGQGGTADLTGGVNTFTGTSSARQGSYLTHLSENGYPVLYNGDSLQYLFDTNDIPGAKTVYRDVNHLLIPDEHGCLSYDSDNYYAYYDPAQGDGGSFKVYDGTYELGEVNPTPPYTPSETKAPVGFFPFDDYDPTRDNLAPTDDLQNYRIEGYNHQFGLTMTAKFYLPESGTVEGNELIFHFSGDDDALVFIDDVLVMDIGGLHRPTDGDINFAAGTVTVDAAVPTWNNSYSTAYGTSVKLTDLLGDDFYNDPNKEHELKFFYLERGGCYSNMALETNLYMAYPTTNLTVQKKWEDGETAHAGEEIRAHLYANDTLIPECEILLNSENDWTMIIKELPIYAKGGKKIVYTVKEEEVEGYTASYEYFDKGQQITYEKETVRTIWVPADNFEDGETYLITADDWFAHTGTIALTRDPSGQNGLAGKLITVVNEPITVFETEYASYVEEAAPASQWTSMDKGYGWTLNCLSNHLALAGYNNQWYWFTSTTSDGWNSSENVNYNATLSYDPNSKQISTLEYWGNGYGGFYAGPTQYLYMQNGTTPAATNVPAYSGHYNLYRKVNITETERIVTEAPSDLCIITNTPEPEKPEPPKPEPPKPEPPKPEPEKPKDVTPLTPVKSVSPKTGDIETPALLFVLLLLSASVPVLSLYRRRLKQR